MTYQRIDEEWAVERGKDRYNARIKAAEASGHETDTLVGRQLLRETVAALRKELDPWMDRASTSPGRRHSALDVLGLVEDRDLLAVLIIRSILDGISRPRNLTNVALRVGTAIEQEYRLTEVSRQHPGLVASIESAQFGGRSRRRKATWIEQGVSKIKSFTIPRTPQASRLRAGAIALEIFRVSTGFISITTEARGRRKTVKVVSASDSLKKWLGKAHAAHELLRPLLPPMTHPPVDWTSPISGGYIKLPLPLIKKSRRQEDFNMPRVYKAVNAHQATPWRINGKILDVMQTAWERGMPLGDLPTATLTPMPTKPLDIDKDEEVRKRYGKAANWVRSHNATEKSRRLHVAQLLSIAKPLALKTLYMPVNLDFRGRMYAAPSVLNPMSSTLSRSLLMFDRSKRIADSRGWGERYFFMHGANLFGISGEEDARTRWVEENTREIIKNAAHPLAQGMWQEAKRPWEFLAWAMEFAGYISEGKNFRSHLPVNVDGSNNGCQIWSLLLKDETTAKATNVYPNEEPADLYRELACDLIAKLSEDSCTYAVEWLKSGLIDRTLVKGAVMIVPYSAQLIGMGNSILNALYEKYRMCPHGSYHKPEWDSDKKACYYLACFIKDAMGLRVPAVLQGMTWAQEVAGICADHGKAVEWTLPTGFQVRNDYRKPRYKTVQTWMGDKYVVNSLASSSSELNKRRCVQTLMANLTHSCDAALLHTTIVKAEDQYGLQDFNMIHDSFGTHAVDIKALKESLALSAAEVFGNSSCLLTQLRQRMLSLLPSGVDLPRPPIVGDFHPDLVYKSTYFAS